MRKQKYMPVIKDSIAIIGEGLTEREYFKSLKHFERLPFKFKPDVPKHSDIKSIISKAISLAESFDFVYCIVDLDRILLNAKELDFYSKNKVKYQNIIFIESNPCFEIWLLLHFEFSTRTYNNCHSLIGFLKKYISDYEKSFNYLSNKDLYLILYSKMENAIQNSKKLDKSNSESKCDIYRLILELNKLKL